MTVVNVQEAKTQLSRLLTLVEAGEEVVIARYGKKVARLVRIAPPAPDGRGNSKPWRDVLCAAALLLCASLPLLLSACGKPQAVPPNVLLISVDTLNRSALRAFDEEAQPLRHLDAFAAAAATFLNANSTASWTLPAHASLMTGLYPDRHGAVVRGRGLPEGVQTLAARLKARGYETVGLTGGGYVDWRLGFSAGFDRYDDWSVDGVEGAENDTGLGEAEIARSDRALFRRGIDFLRQRSSDGPPFFLFLHTYGVHDYFQVHPWAKALLPELDDPDPSANLDCLLGRRSCPAEEWERLKRLYNAELPNLDESFGQLLQAVEETSGDTVIVLLSDHGEGFAPARGRIHHGGRLQEDLIRIPLLVRGPGIAAGDVEAPVSLVDVMPTLLELAGSGPAETENPSKPPEPTDGRSFANELVDETRRLAVVDRPLFAHEHYHRWDEGRRLDVKGGRRRALAVAVIRGEFWYIDGMQGEELYRMADDPDQFRDRSGDADIVADLRELAQARSMTRDGAAVDLDGELTRHLRALGYVD